MGTLFVERKYSPLDILVKNFFNQDEEFTTPNNRILNHPVDIYEDKTGLFFDIACTGLTKKQVKVDIEGDILRVSYTKDKDEDEEKDIHVYHSGIAKRNFNLGWKIARRFDLSKIEGSMKDGLLKLHIPLTPESKPKTVSIK